jgi:signal transduction histidine kinase
MPRSFAFRLTAAFAGIGISAAALTAILVNFAFGARFTSYLEERQGARERLVVATLADSYREAGEWNPDDLAALAPAALMDGGTVRLEDSSGRTVWEATEESLGTHMAEMHREMMGSGSLGPEESLPVRLNGEIVGTAFVRLPEAGLIPQDADFRLEVNRLLIFGGIAAGLIAVALGVFLGKRATSPAQELTRAAKDLAAGDRARRVDVTTEDEFGEMGRAFNAMADALDEEDRLRRSFAADVAHELRTPLAILQSQIEGMQDGVVKSNGNALASLHEEVLRLSRSVADLETLASADAAGFSLALEDVRFDELVIDSTQQFGGPFDVAEVALETDVETTAVVVGDPVRLQQVVSNLLSNALKFTPAGGHVHVHLGSDDAWAQLRVSDTGSGIPPDELERVFERFFRGRQVLAGGSGIGLSVVNELVRAHGGEISVSSEVGQGTTFTVRLPLAPSKQHKSFTASS